MGQLRGTMLACGATALASVTLPGAVLAPAARAASTPAAVVSSLTPGASSAGAGALPARARELLIRPRGGGLQRITLRAGLDPQAIARELRRRPDLFASAGANLIATASGIPVTSGNGASTEPTTPPTVDGIVAPPGTTPGTGVSVDGLRGWIPNDHIGTVAWPSLQWNFVGQWGVNATEAWEQLRRRGRSSAGGRRVRIAVVDSGIAYRTAGPYKASPDLPRSRILQGYDFVDEDRFPDDESGHGTHVASTIAAATNNDAGLTGLAYEADILPVRVLDDQDAGDVLAIARGIRYAIRRHADLINLSADFPVSASVADIPEVMSAISAAHRAGILVVSSSGNDGVGQVALPARSRSVLSVGATTVRGCRSKFSNGGDALDLVAPGGGTDHRGERSGRCRPGLDGPPIAQITVLNPGDPSVLGVPLDYIGTSMAAAHVTGVAALALGSGTHGRHPTPDLPAAYLIRSTRDLGGKGRDDRYGAGLIDAQRATDRTSGAAAARGARRAVARAARSTGSRDALPIP